MRLFHYLRFVLSLGDSLGRGMGLDYVRGTEAAVWAEGKGGDGWMDGCMRWTA